MASPDSKKECTYGYVSYVTTDRACTLGYCRSFAANFLVAGAILVVGILCFLLLLGKIEQIQAPQVSQDQDVQPVANTD